MTVAGHDNEQRSGADATESGSIEGDLIGRFARAVFNVTSLVVLLFGGVIVTCHTYFPETYHNFASSIGLKSAVIYAGFVEARFLFFHSYSRKTHGHRGQMPK